MEKVLITGGSEGIGFAFAKEYAKRHCHLYLAARNKERLSNAADHLRKQFSVPVEIIACDLAVDGAAQDLYRQLKSENIDVVINNAGCGYAGSALSIDIDADERMVHLNVISLMTLTKLFASQMAGRKHGTILNVASTGAFQPGPYIASYYASKSFVLSYTRAVKEEMKGSGVHVYCLCPGPVDTAFYQKSGGVRSRFYLSPDACAAYTLDHMKSKTVLIPGHFNRMAMAVPSGMRMKYVAHQKKKK